MLNKNDFLTLHGILESEVSQLRQLGDMKFSEVNEICSILLGKETTCGKIDFTIEKDFIVAYFKKEESLTKEYDYVEMGIHINDDFEVDYVWNYIKGNHSGVSSQRLHNHNEITAYLIKKKFDVFGLNRKEK